MMEVGPTGYVILGMLSWRPMSGYDIKAIVDQSTRFFWAASYGQIYPELGRLADAGLIEGRATAPGRDGGAPSTGSPQPAAGACASGWRRSPRRLEMRDEGLLKLFFAVRLAPERRRHARGQAAQATRSSRATCERWRRPASRRGTR